MYNRYIPQPDGSFQKRCVQEPKRPNPPRSKTITPKNDTCPAQPQISEVCPPPKKPERHPCSQPKPYRQDSIIGFFRQLLPRDLDTADLLIILLLLLMAGDCEEERNTALLTLALYFFM